jgi:enediyne biosynthesis protein E4
VTTAAGIDFRHLDGRSGRKYFVETIGSGCAFIDVDNDDLLDIYLVNAANLPCFRSKTLPTNALYHNTGDGTFADVTKKAGVGHPGYGTGVAAGDYNNDGFIDLYVTNFGENALYRNTGNGTFVDVTEKAGVGDPQWSAGAAFADYDNDGFLDLYVT